MNTKRSLLLAAVIVVTFAAGAFVIGTVRARGNVSIDRGPAVIDVDNPAHMATLEARIAASNAHDFAGWQALHADGCVRTAPELAVPLVGATSMRAALEHLVAVFPDYRVQLVRAVGHGAWLAATLSSSGTLPTGAAFAQTWTAFVRFDGAGRIVEFHEHYDQLDVIAQVLGAQRPRVERALQ